MPAKVFLDTNIVLYLYSNDEIVKKQLIIEKINTFKNIYISNQVLNEFINISLRKFYLPVSKVNQAVKELIKNFDITNINELTTLRALKISEKYKYSFYDSLIITAALDIDCEYLFSEDLHHKQIIERNLTIINPFK